jgi:hypothetical protein
LGYPALDDINKKDLVASHRVFLDANQLQITQLWHHDLLRIWWLKCPVLYGAKIHLSTVLSRFFARPEFERLLEVRWETSSLQKVVRRDVGSPITTQHPPLHQWGGQKLLPQ